MENNIPQLRFSEFTENWSKVKIENIFSIFNGYAFKSTDSTNEGTLWVKIADVGIQKMKDNNLSYLPNSFKDKHSKYLLKKNDYVVALTRPILSGELKIARINDFFNNSLLNQRVGKIESNENIDYIYYLLQNNRLIKSIENNIAGSDPPNLSPKEINNIKVGLPTPTEQTKIATFLTAVDKRINLLQKKKAELEQYKKGVMQKIFSQTLRFKKEDGSDFEDWEEKKLGEIGRFQTSSVDKLSKEDEREVYLVNYMNVYRHENINNSTRNNLQVVTAKEKQIESSDLKRGDILFTPSSETPTDIGHSVVIFEDLDDTLFSYHLMRFRPNIKLDLLYSHYFCNIPSVLKQLSSYATGSTRFTISVGNFSKIKVSLPSFEEQQKIANFLSSIDKSIGNIANQIDDSVIFKKGLLQKMFM